MGKAQSDTARCGNTEASAQIRIRIEQGKKKDDKDPPPTQQVIAWAGEVPPQK